MSASDQRVFARDLTLALCLLDSQGLVARGISPATVFWDGTSVQLWGVEGVTRAGRPRVPWGRAPFASPEQHRGEGVVDPRDAVWSAAQVLYQLVTGRPGPADRAPADLDRHRVLAGTLPRAFAPTAAGRPTPGALLELLAPEEARRLGSSAPADGFPPAPGGVRPGAGRQAADARSPGGPGGRSTRRPAARGGDLPVLPGRHPPRPRQAVRDGRPDAVPAPGPLPYRQPGPA
ncbi:hypothetical protein RB201_18640 [Streptomyces sp. S1A(2023)]